MRVRVRGKVETMCPLCGKFLARTVEALEQHLAHAHSPELSRDTLVVVDDEARDAARIGGPLPIVSG